MRGTTSFANSLMRIRLVWSHLGRPEKVTVGEPASEVESHVVLEEMPYCEPRRAYRNCIRQTRCAAISKLCEGAPDQASKGTQSIGHVFPHGFLW